MTQQNVVISARKSDGSIRAIKTDSNGALDVFIQDQTTPIVNAVLYHALETVTLAANTVVDSKTITVNAGHSIGVGNIISMRQNTSFYQGFVTNVAGNTITLDTPLDKIFTTTAIVTRGNANMNANGSVAPVSYHVIPPSGSSWDITQLVLYIIDDAAMDDTTLGGIGGGVTNGIVLRKHNAVYDNIGNAKKHGDLKAQGCNVVYAIKVGGGEYSMQSVCEFGGQGNTGVVVRLNGAIGEEIQAIVQDDLSSITQVTAVVIGHVVE